MQKTNKPRSVPAEKKISMELIFLALFAASLICCVITGASVIFALIFGYILFFSYGLIHGKNIKEMFLFSKNGLFTVKNVLLTLLLISMLTAIWRACGSIAYIVYYASAICTPHIMLLASFLLCCLISFLTGTSFGSAATIGVICMTMANSMGISPVLTGGAVLAGIFFGDRCSPVSTSALLVSELTKTDLFSNIRNMFRSALVPFGITCVIYTTFLLRGFSGIRNMARSALVPFILSCILYGILGFSIHTGTAADTTRNLLRDYYKFSPLLLLPVAIVLILSLLRIDVKKTIAISGLVGMVIAAGIQHFPVSELPSLCFSGFSPSDVKIAKLMSGGGFLSMLRVYLIVGISSCYSGMFEGTSFLNGIESMMKKLNSRITPYGTTLLTSVVTSAISCNQTLAIMLTSQLCGENRPEKSSFALDLENTVVVIAPMIPWSIAGAVPLAAIGAPNSSIGAAFYLYLLPLWGLAVHLTKPSDPLPTDISCNSDTPPESSQIHPD